MNDDPRSAERSCPAGVGWCHDHEVLDVEYDDGRRLERHRRELFTHVAGDPDFMPGLTLDVTDFGQDLSDGPRLSLRMSLGQHPARAVCLEPDQARELAVALLAASGIVEAVSTATCGRCRRRVTPEALEVFGECGGCQEDRQTAERAEVRASLKVVRA